MLAASSSRVAKTFSTTGPESLYFDCCGNPSSGVEGWCPSKENLDVALVNYQVYIHDVEKLKGISAMMNRFYLRVGNTCQPTVVFGLNATIN